VILGISFDDEIFFSTSMVVKELVTRFIPGNAHVEGLSI
jgi:hypothetical protein